MSDLLFVITLTLGLLVTMMVLPVMLELTIMVLVFAFDVVSELAIWALAIVCIILYTIWCAVVGVLKMLWYLAHALKVSL